MSVRVATPAERFTDPKLLAPSRKLTLPVAPAGETVDDRVMLWPAVEGLGDAEKTIPDGLFV